MLVQVTVFIYCTILSLDYCTLCERKTSIDNRYRYSTFCNNRYHDQISICTYVHVYSVQGIYLKKKKHPSNLTCTCTTGFIFDT